jgi:hypothetical protein
LLELRLDKAKEYKAKSAKGKGAWSLVQRKSVTWQLKTIFENRVSKVAFSGLLC